MNSTLSISGVFVVLLFGYTSVVFSIPCEDDATCVDFYGDLASCKNSTCGCVDFHGLVGSKCSRWVGLGGKCNAARECTNALGAASTCEDTTKTCVCKSVDGSETGYWNGKCYKLRPLGQPCAEDGECILGSNELSRCINQTCSCYTNYDNVILSLVVGEDGLCHPAQCNETTSMSVFAVTAAGSVGLFVVIVLIYQFTKRQI